MSTVKQLKKNDFLSAVTEKPMTREQLVDVLDGFEFITSYLDYLTDHFVAQKKVLKNEDGTIQRKVKKAGGSSFKDLYRVVELEQEVLDADGQPVLDDQGEPMYEDVYELEHRDLQADGGYYDNEAKEAGWRQTPNAAIKVASSAAFTEYKARTSAIKALAPVVEEAESETDAA
jgi:hypothetical protein